jgi:hypothetical protein
MPGATFPPVLQHSRQRPPEGRHVQRLDQEIRRPLAHGQRTARVLGAEDLEAIRSQRVAKGFAHRAVVVHDQDTSVHEAPPPSSAREQ